MSANSRAWFILLLMPMINESEKCADGNVAERRLRLSGKRLAKPQRQKLEALTQSDSHLIGRFRVIESIHPDQQRLARRNRDLRGLAGHADHAAGAKLDQVILTVQGEHTQV